MEQQPDYSFYSMDDLLDVMRRVDRQRYPERYAAMVQEIEKRRQQGVSIPGNAVQDPALLMVLRFFGGMVLAVSLPLLLVGLALAADVPYGYGLPLPELLVVIVMFGAVAGGGIYAALHLQEAKIARRPLPVGMRVVMGGLSVLLRLCGGFVLASFACMPLAMLTENSTLVVPGGTLETVLMMIAAAINLLGGLLAVWLPLGRTARNKPH